MRAQPRAFTRFIYSHSERIERSKIIGCYWKTYTKKFDSFFTVDSLKYSIINIFDKNVKFNFVMSVQIWVIFILKYTYN